MVVVEEEEEVVMLSSARLSDPLGPTLANQGERKHTNPGRKERRKRAACLACVRALGSPLFLWQIFSRLPLTLASPHGLLSLPAHQELMTGGLALCTAVLPLSCVCVCVAFPCG